MPVNSTNVRECPSMFVVNLSVGISISKYDIFSRVFWKSFLGYSEHGRWNNLANNYKDLSDVLWIITKDIRQMILSKDSFSQIILN